MPPQRSIHLTQRLRPVRLGFLTRGTDDLPAIRRWIGIATCLWGGMYNPIIPVYRQRPNWWPGPRTGREITEGYLDAFEPDYLIAASESLFEAFSFPEKRCLTTERLLSAEDLETPFRVGLGVQHLYEDQYQKRFQFVQRDPAQFIIPKPGAPGLIDLLRICFGEFPTSGPLEHLRDSYRFVFNAQDVDVSPSNFVSLLTTRTSYPIKVGAFELSVHRRNTHTGPRIFVLNEASPRDLIDYWNLRALGWQMLPVPQRWVNALASEVKTFVDNSLKPHSQIADQWISTRVLTARSLDGESVRKSLRNTWNTDHSRAFRVTTHFPRIWDEWARPKDDASRCEITASRRRDSVLIKKGRLSFERIKLPLETSQPRLAHSAWVEAITLAPGFSSYEVATDFPQDLEQIWSILKSPSTPRPWLSSEGITQPLSFAGTHNWKIPTGTAVFKDWFEQRGFSFTVSSAGKLAREAIARLGSLRRVTILRNAKTVKFMERMAHGLMEIQIDNEHEVENLNRARGRIASFDSVLGHLKRVCRSDEVALTWLGIMTDRRVLRLGARIQCSHCDQNNWYPLDDLSRELECERCLQEFHFPLSQPPQYPWAYRAAGPFAVELYMQGSYTVIFAIRVLWDLSGFDKGLTWAPSFNLRRDHGVDLEADFAAYWEDQGSQATRKRIVLGECKSFNEFGESDIERMKALGREVPGGVLAFCTLNQGLSGDERKLIGELAREQWRRYPDPSANRVLVLTGSELFSEVGIPYCWENMEGKFAEYRNRGSLRHDLESLCNATQDLYLDIDTSEEIQRAIRDW